ncbi:MAG TPA: hypothetical protein PLY78_01695 [Methanospirillum sp.]|nr:hypothetical protein [Methanospirillum sp.]
MQNPDDTIRILEPVVLADREIYPVVSVHSWAGKQGGMIHVRPCALLIREDEAWFFVSVDETVPDIPSHLSQYSGCIGAIIRNQILECMRK